MPILTSFRTVLFHPPRRRCISYLICMSNAVSHCGRNTHLGFRRLFQKRFLLCLHHYLVQRKEMHSMHYTNTLIFATLFIDTLWFSTHRSGDFLPSYLGRHSRESHLLVILFRHRQPSAIMIKTSSMEWTTLSRDIGDVA
jgi:hypothetical protein